MGWAPGRMDDEKQFIRKLSTKNPNVDRPEIAVEFARLLIAHERYHDARLIVRTALDEGPRYDLYEMRACSTDNNLGELWKKIHELLGEKPEKHSSEIYNDGIHTPDPDWKEVLSQLTGK